MITSHILNDGYLLTINYDTGKATIADQDFRIVKTISIDEAWRLK